MLAISHTELRACATRVFRAAGASQTTAGHVAESLVDSDLAGHESHGAIRIVVNKIGFEPANKIVFVRESITNFRTVYANRVSTSGE